MTISVWIALVGGIIIGWLIEWVVDWVYWRRGLDAFYATEQQLRWELREAEERLAEANDTIAALTLEVATLRKGEPYPPDSEQASSAPAGRLRSRDG